MATTPTALEGLRVVELGGGLAASYATKLLGLLGADVIKVEPRTGDPERLVGPFRDDLVDGERGGGLFRYCNADKRSVCCDTSDEDDRTTLRSLLAGADLVVEALGPGGLEALGLAPDDYAVANPHLAFVRISAHGQDGPYATRPATGITVQAAGSWVSNHGIPTVSPVQTGGRLHDYTIGAFAACAALTAVRSARAGEAPVVADLAGAEVMLGTQPYPMLLHEDYVRLGLTVGEERRATLPGILACADGWVGVNALTGLHFRDICAMTGIPQFEDRQREIATDPVLLAEFFDAMRPWLMERTVDDIVSLCQAFRIPAAPVGDGEKLPRYPQFQVRPFYTAEPDGDLRFPGPPWRLSATPASARRAAAALSRAATAAAAFHQPRVVSPVAATTDPALPFAGLRVVDLGTFWAGPYFTMYLGAFGADVVKVESIQRPDGFRFVGAFPEDGDDFYERSGIWQGTNLDKRGVTLDARRPEGRDLLRALVARADVVVENFSVRVIEEFGLGYEDLRELNPGLIMVRMPAFGLDGPWRDYVGWAMGIEQAAGMAQVTGPGELPMHPGGFADPMISMHMGVAVQAALEHRDRTGEGQLIEVAQLETAACLTADQVMDFDLNGRLAPRVGNRTGPREIPMAPQGVFATRDREWIAVSVRDDADWSGLLESLGRPLWATEEFAGVAARLAEQTQLEEMLAGSFAAHDADVLLERIVAHGVPAAKVLRPPAMYADPQLDHRGFYAPLDHPLTGVRRYPAWPMRFSFTDLPHRFGAPTLGGHNAEVLAEVGVDPATLADLEATGIVGTRMVGT